MFHGLKLFLRVTSVEESLKTKQTNKIKIKQSKLYFRMKLLPKHTTVVRTLWLN